MRRVWNTPPNFCMRNFFERKICIVLYKHIDLKLLHLMSYLRRSLSERLETENSRRREESAALRQRMEKEKEELREYINRDVGQVRTFFQKL